MNCHLNEWRALRDAYALRAADALARHNPAMGERMWRGWIERYKAHPCAMADCLQLYLDRIAVMEDWSAVSRFAWLADLVWGFESEALDDVTFPRWTHHARKNSVAA